MQSLSKEISFSGFVSGLGVPACASARRTESSLDDAAEVKRETRG